MFLVKAVSVAGPDSITSKPLKSDGVNSAPEPSRTQRKKNWLQKETGALFLTRRGNTVQTRQIEHLCPRRLASRMHQRAAFIFSALWSLAEEIGHE